MSNEMQIFSSEQFGRVRVVELEGEPWFVASDVAKALGYRDAANMTRRIDAEDQGYSITSTPGGEQRVSVVNESGLYQGVFCSSRPEAKQFRRWVTSEVLPSVRKHGGYLTPQATEAALTDPDFIIRLATSLKEERAKVEQLEVARSIDAPKVEVFDEWIDNGRDLNVQDFARQVGLSVAEVCRFLQEDMGHMCVRSTAKRGKAGVDAPKRVAVDGGWLSQRVFVDRYGNRSVRAKITPKGAAYYHRRMVESGLI